MAAKTKTEPMTLGNMREQGAASGNSTLRCARQGAKNGRRGLPGVPAICLPRGP